MEYQRIIQLLVKQFNRQLHDHEKPELEQWRRIAVNREEMDQYRRTWELSGRYKDGYGPDVEKGWERFRQRIPAAPVPRRRRVAWGVMLALLVTALLTLFFLWKGAGKTTRHSDGPVAVVTGPSERQDIHLPDGSTVVLNENSRLSYPATWEESSARELRLSGEAFFRVTPDPARPFLVHTSHTAIRVLGTAFNVRAYPGEPTTEVAVEDGKVSLLARQLGQKLDLGVLDKGICDVNGAFFREENAGQNARAWQTGTLWFRKTPLREVARSLDHYFNVKLDIGQPEIADCKINQPAFKAGETFSALQAIAYSLGARVVQTAPNTYLFQDGTCR